MTTVASSTTLWYLSRGTGVATLLLLTASVLLGVVTSYRWSSATWPRFTIEFVHRNVSLLVVAFLAAHVVTVVGDAYAPIGWVDALVPFLSPYRRFWLGLGTLAADVLIALVVTSLLRHRIGYRTWRIVHWFAYLCWPLAVVHGLGTGSDTKLGVVLVITAVCVVSVLIAVGFRLTTALADHAVTRRLGLAASAFAPIVLAVWLASGPLASGWARRAGTPAGVGQGSAADASVAAPSPTTATATAPGSISATGFRASVAGTYRESAPDADGRVVVSLVGPLRGETAGTLDVELHGRPLNGGGVALERGTVTLTGAGSTGTFTGPVVGLEGEQIIADVAAPDGTRLRVSLDFTQLDSATETMSGTVVGTPAPDSERGQGGQGGDDR